jgi:hypothetical protein
MIIDEIEKILKLEIENSHKMVTSLGIGAAVASKALGRKELATDLLRTIFIMKQNLDNKIDDVV